MATDQATVKSILLGSPPGQFDIILEDLRSLLPKSSIPSALEPNFVSDVRSEWESATGRSGLAAASDADGGDGCIASLSKAMDEYLASVFSSPGVRAAQEVTASSTLEGTPAIAISIYAERIDLHNHHAGWWRGCYTICPSSGYLTGKVSICAHTFENGGNVQLHSDIVLEATNVETCSPSDGSDKLSSWASAVKRQIGFWEERDVMDNLSEMYESMGNTYLKSLRRVMPITRTKMEWNVAAHRLLQTLGKGHDKDKFKH